MKHLLAGIIIVVSLASGCTMEGQLSEESKNKLMFCKDTRDGETFTFNTHTISNIRIGIGVDSSVDIVTTEGKKKTVKSSDDVWLKCEEKPNA